MTALPAEIDYSEEHKTNPTKKLRLLSCFEAVAACNAERCYFVNVLLVDGENLADLGPALAIHNTQAFAVKHRTSNKQRTACCALGALALPQKQLFFYITGPEMHKIKTP